MENIRQKPRNTWIDGSYVLVMENIMKFPTNYKQIMALHGETEIEGVQKKVDKCFTSYRKNG